MSKKWLSICTLSVVLLGACANDTSEESVEDIVSNIAQDTFNNDIELRDGDLKKPYVVGDTVIQVNEINLPNDEELEGYFTYQAVHVNATIENTSDEDQIFDLWAQIRVGSVSDRDSFGALQLSAYGLEGYEMPGLNNDDLFILVAGESVTYDFLFDVIVPEEDNDVKVIYQINPMNHIVWEIDGFSELEPSEEVEIGWDVSELEPSEVEEIDWDAYPIGEPEAEWNDESEGESEE